MEERWLPVVGWRDLYEVSDHGRVRSLDRVVRPTCRPYTKKGRIMKTSFDGAEKVLLRHEGSIASASVARLVLSAFDRDPNKNEMAIHSDGNPRNNHVSNLSWGTFVDREMNEAVHGKHLGLEKHPRAIIDSGIAARIRASDGSLSEIANSFGVPKGVVRAVKSGVTWKVRHAEDYRIPWRVRHNRGKGRVKGERVHLSKLTSEKVLEIKTSHSQLSASKVALMYGVTKSTIAHIRAGRTWRHVA